MVVCLLGLFLWLERAQSYWAQGQASDKWAFGLRIHSPESLLHE